MTMIAERLFVNIMIGSASSSDLTSAVMDRIVRIARLDYPDWMDQLAADGFTEEEIQRLDSFVPGLFNGPEMESRLAAMFAGIKDLQNQAEINYVIRRWLEQMDLADICNQVFSSEFPDLINALASAVRYMLDIAGSVAAFEVLKRIPPDPAYKDWKVEPWEVAEGIAIAEEGLEQDMAKWPEY